MAKINVGRVLLGGIVAGIVSDALGYLVDGRLLAPNWSDAMLALGRSDLGLSQFLYFDAFGIVGGIVMIWIYAAILPRFGPGAFTAIYAALSVWIVGVLIPNLSFMWVADLFPNRLTAFTTAGGLIELLVGGIVGAILYKDPPPIYKDPPASPVA